MTKERCKTGFREISMKSFPTKIQMRATSGFNGKASLTNTEKYSLGLVPRNAHIQNFKASIACRVHFLL